MFTPEHIQVPVHYSWQITLFIKAGTRGPKGKRRGSSSAGMLPDEDQPAGALTCIRCRSFNRHINWRSDGTEGAGNHNKTRRPLLYKGHVSGGVVVLHFVLMLCTQCDKVFLREAGKCQRSRTDVTTAGKPLGPADLHQLLETQNVPQLTVKNNTIVTSLCGHSAHSETLKVQIF